MSTKTSALAALGFAACLLQFGCAKAAPAPATTAPAAPPASANKATPTASANTAPAPAATPAASASGEGQLSTLVITNKSGWAVHHLYLSPTKENEWGQDQLGTNVVETGEAFTLNSIPCNTYDIKVVDEDGDECVVKGEKWCGDQVTWDLTKDELLGCEGYGDE
jgi:hypothetical protein